MSNFNHIFNQKMLGHGLLRVMGPQALDLLACNLNGVPVEKFKILNDRIEKDLDLYEKSTEMQSNYSPVDSLEDWINPKYPYPNIHPHHQKILDVIKNYEPKSACELGAGAGQVSKYVYANNPSIDLCCVENSRVHSAQMLENFESRTGVIPPDIKVNAKIVNNSIHGLQNVLADGSYELVFTCTVMMHLPFLIAPAVACEAARISSRYVLHIENKNDKINAAIRGDTSEIWDGLTIDYKALYDKLGFNCVFYEEVPDPHADCEYVYFLAEKL